MIFRSYKNAMLRNLVVLELLQMISIGACNNPSMLVYKSQC